MKRYILTLFIITFSTMINTFAFTWPQKIDSKTNVFSSFFGQTRGETFINSLIFEDSAIVTAADSGQVIMHLDSGISDMGWFESTLGNTVILAHNNDMLTVYGNLEEITYDSSNGQITEGAELGISGSSGWQQGKNCLEFQVVDIKRKTVINPFVLMPVFIKKDILTIQNFCAINKTGKKVELSHESRIASGIYKLYINKQHTGMTYKTLVTINGATYEIINYNMIKQNHNRLCISGKNDYTFEELYPDKDKQFIAEVVFSKGKNSVVVNISDIFGNEKSMTYNIDVF